LSSIGSGGDLSLSFLAPLLDIIGNLQYSNQKTFKPIVYYEWRNIIMGKAPEKCPMCGEKDKWILVDSGNKGFSVGKAAAGALLLGPVGLVGGALGKRKECYCCGKCGFSHEY
jgi:hypothetical protein